MHRLRAHSWVVLFVLGGCVGNQSFDNGEEGVEKGEPDSGTPAKPPTATDDERTATSADASTAESTELDAASNQDPPQTETVETSQDSGAGSDETEPTRDAEDPSDPPVTAPLDSQSTPPVDAGTNSAVEPNVPTDAATAQPPPQDDAAAEAPSLDGTWDVIYSSIGGGSNTLTTTLNEALLQITGGFEFSAVVSEGALALSYKSEQATATRVMPGTLDLGVLPDFLQGDMHFIGVPDNGGYCNSSVSLDELSVECSDRVDSPFRYLDLTNLRLSASRTSPGQSIFGDLGGEWSLVSGEGTCSISLLGNTVNLSCSGSEVEGTATFSVDGDTIGGQTSGGIEFTAQRR